MDEFITGKWYAIGFTDDNGVMQWGEILHFDGDGCWSDETGEPVESLYDPMLRLPVAMNAADAYQVQS